MNQILTHKYNTGHKIIDNINGSCINVQLNALLLSPLKCWPKYKKGIKDIIIENIGLKVPQGPIPPLISFQIIPITPKGFTLLSSG